MQEGFAAEHGREVLGHPVRCAGLLSQLFVASIATVQTSILLLVLQRDYCPVLLIQATVTVPEIRLLSKLCLAFNMLDCAKH